MFCSLLLLPDVGHVVKLECRRPSCFSVLAKRHSEPLVYFNFSPRIKGFWPPIARMSVVDKLDAARHSITGSYVAKVVCKASSREVMGPKRKHLDCKFAHWKNF